jgi:signal transduction histidine kinase
MIHPGATVDRKFLLEEALQESRAQALAGQYAAATMHEINGPLEAIANLNYLIQINSKDTERVRGYSRMIEEQLKTAIAISRQTLSFYHSKDDAQSVQIAFLVEAALRVHVHKIVAKEIQLMKQLPADIEVEIYPGAMLQVLSNLISNAVEALPTKGTLSVRAHASDSYAHILVADNGHGIPAEILPVVFEPFISTKGSHGTGLGLAITRNLVERHRGRILTRSSTRSGMSGTAFRVSLPLRRQPAFG